MARRIAVTSKISDTRAEVRKRKLDALGFRVNNIHITDLYTLDGDTGEDVGNLAALLHNPVTQIAEVDTIQAPEFFDYVIEVGFLPGVTDNVGKTAEEIAEDSVRRQLTGHAYNSQLTFLSGPLSRDEVDFIAASLSNPVVQRTRILSRAEYEQGGIDIQVPRVKIQDKPKADLIDIVHATDEDLATIGKKGIANADGSRRGPLALDLTYMKAIREYFIKQGRNPADLELESIAQTWSEHCRHTLFADQIDEVREGLFRTYIKGATEKIIQERSETGLEEFCVSIFTDNAGVIVFDENHLITDKVETHNAPSALDPFGGAITGIVGVNRDAIGAGMGARPFGNRYYFFFAEPEDDSPIYKGENKTQKMLSPRRILDGVIDGVNVGGNCSGIPTTQGGMFFDSRYKGKPLVFVGTLGIMPREVEGRKMYEKKANPGDLIVMVGGRVGKDGIHGATFSSEAMDAGSPVTAVQIGDPITQKKLSDALINEARDRNLYTSITDNGAGGLSCSVAEMAKESGGCYVNLDKVPLKYPGLKPWEIWISESQERMTLSVPREKWAEFSDLMKRRGVESTVIGEFTQTGKCIVDYGTERVMNLEMDFLHGGLPPRPVHTAYTKQHHEEPPASGLEDLTQTLHDVLARKNIASTEFISQQYDHEVQGGSVLKPLQGRGRVNGDATILRPVLGSNKGVILSQGVNPSYGDIDMYYMAVAAIDTAIRNAVAVGADLEHLALLDNFCWCSSNEPERLGQLKQACEACYDTATSYGTPFISGKDSMFNDFKGYDEDGHPIKISVPPTLFISSLGIMEDTRKAVSLDAKVAGDLVYVLGKTYDELGGSEYYAMRGEKERGRKFIGNEVPKIDFYDNKTLYKAHSQAVGQELVASATSVHKGGLAVALAKTSMGGMLGLDISLDKLKREVNQDDKILFSESLGRLIVTVNPTYKQQFEKLMEGTYCAQVGVVRPDNKFIVRGVDGKQIINTTVDSMSNSYKSAFKDF